MAEVMNGGKQAEHTVLVVENDPGTVKLLSLYLTCAGYRVTVACGGEEALRMAMEQRPTAITLDLILPDRDGWEVLTCLKESPLTRDIPVLVVSVLDRQSLAFRLGADEYLVKPVKRATLLYALQRTLDRGSSSPRGLLLSERNED